MKFEEVIPALRAGKKVRRIGWDKPARYVSMYSYLQIDGLLNYNDWEIIEEWLTPQEAFEALLDRKTLISKDGTLLRYELKSSPFGTNLLLINNVQVNDISLVYFMDKKWRLAEEGE